MFEPQALGEIDSHRSAVRPDYLRDGFGTRRPLAPGIRDRQRVFIYRDDSGASVVITFVCRCCLLRKKIYK